MSDKIGVSLIKYACPICGQAKDELSAIAMNTRLSKKAAEDVEKLNGKIVGFAEKPCKECQSYIDQGAFFIIGVGMEKTGKDTSNPYRSGHLVGIKKESEFYKNLPEEYKKKDALYMDYREMEQLGMINRKD